MNAVFSSTNRLCKNKISYKFAYMTQMDRIPVLHDYKETTDNMYKTTGLKNSRIEVADALRGLAVAGIILFHSVEHFNTFAREIKYTLPCDGTVFNVLQALLSGKMYGIFAVLFGLSFFIMRDNQEQKGKDFSLRFAWRMVLLFLFGVLNVCFYILP